MARINIVNLNKRRRVEGRAVRNVVKMAFERLSQYKVKTAKNLKEINIVFVRDRYIKKLNNTYKHKNRPTDVLCFNMSEETDIFISSDRALINSKRFGTSAKYELFLYVIHGLLHMFGFRDDTIAARRKMEKVQYDIMGSVCGERLA